VNVVANLWARVKSSPSFTPTGEAIPGANVDGLAHDPVPFRAGSHYFSVVVKELFLQNGRQWFSTYDPMVFALTEFSYAGQPRSVPFVLGPGLLQPYDQKLPHEMLFRDTRVLELHPFRGDDVALTLILGQVQRANYAAEILKIVESVGGAVGAAAGLGPYLKIADALLGAADTLLSAPGTTPLVGMRLGFGGEYSDSPLVPAYLALINAQNVDVAKLRVAGGRLLDASGAPYRAADYVLAYVDQQEQRDERALPTFNELWERAVAEAMDVGATDAWESAKAQMLVLAQTLLLSPDVTTDQARELIVEYKGTLRGIRDEAESIASLGDAEPNRIVELRDVDATAVADARRETIGILDL
jgi:hypothetical protein